MISGNLIRSISLFAGGSLAAICLLSQAISSPAQTKTTAPASNPPAVSPKSAWHWVWAEKTGRIPETVFFRHRFSLPKNVLSAKLSICADDSFRAYLNESKAPIAVGSDYSTVIETTLTRAQLLEENLLAVEAMNTGGPGGLLYRIVAKLPGNKTVVISSGKETRMSQRTPPEWTAFKLDDSKWSFATELAPWRRRRLGTLAWRSDSRPLPKSWKYGSAPTRSEPERKPLTLTASNRMVLSSNATSPALMQLMTQAGFSLFQSDPNHLSTEEVRLNQWDFSQLGTSRTSLQNLGLDWCYFPHLAFPSPLVSTDCALHAIAVPRR